MSLLSVDILKRLASSARAARDAAIGKMRAFTLPTQQPTTVQDHPVPTNVCPPPQSILADLIKLGLRAADASHISQAFQRTALGLKAKFEAKHVATRGQLQRYSYDDPAKTTRLNNSFTATLVTSYTRTLDRWRSAIIDKVQQRICEIRDAQLLQEAQPKKSFNVSAVPTLEKFFEQNTRPSRAEKQQIAAQTCMDYRQISVWFQNRRNRSNKGSPTATTPSETPSEDLPLPPDLAAALTRILAQYHIVEERYTYDEREELLKLATSFAPFHTDRPEHAWPVSFPPLCSEDPFPPSADARKLSTPWYRFPVESHASPPTSDESDLLALLQRWSLGSENKGPRRRSVAGIGFAIRPLPAPLSPTNRECLKVRQHSRTFLSCCEAGTGSRNASYQAIYPPALMKVETPFPRIPCRQAALFESAGNPLRRRRTRSISPLDALSLPLSALNTTRHQSSLDTPTSTPRGRPYPKGKPSRKGIALRTVLTTSRPHHSGGRSPSDVATPSKRRWSTKSRILSPSSPPTALPALSRESSVSSLRSISSASIYSSDTDLLLTPPLLSTSVLDFPVMESLTFDLAEYANEDPFKGLAVNEAPRGAAYLGYSLACGDRDPTLEMPSSLYSQLEPAMSFFHELPLIPTIGSSVLVL